MATFSRAPISRSDFEIGILCSTDLDYTAICLLLDDCWDAEGYTFGRVDGDFNFYVTGRIGSFNVVILMLSDRGKASAAAAAASLRSSYHDLKLIFITGICDGVPGTRGEDGELALGDVVVSKSIVQYDLGRLYSDKLAIKTAVEDSLGRPSRDVRNFIAAMSTRPHRKALEKRAAAHLARIQKDAVNRVIYEYPGSANDILFEPTYHHKLVVTTIASYLGSALKIRNGCKSTKDGIYRDQIARELDIIALETGSAGAWDELPCVIVKGVSGYGDGHKNSNWNNWQNFAAATAASTTRALIERYPSTDKTHIMRNRQVYDACLKDLFITDPEVDKLRIESTKGGLFEKAYNWILTNENYLQWRDNAESRLLWIKGDPGKGKTMLLCGIIDELKKDRPTRNVCHFLCQATDSRLDNATSILRGLLHTIIGRQPVLFSHMRDGYEKAGKKLFEDTNSWYSLSEIFLNLINDPNLESLTIIIDALDECKTNLSQLLDLIAKDLSSSSSKAKWLLSSRNEQDIIDVLATAKNRRAISLELNADSVSKAIEDYVDHQVQALSTLKEYTKDQEAKVKRYLHENANGTFLWVALVCAQLKGAPRSDPLPKSSEYPAELNSLYGRMITKVCNPGIPGQGRKILAIATVSRRPLTITEFNSLVNTSEDQRQSLELVWGDILGYCGSFLTLRDGTVYFVHQSAKDFLITEASAQLFPDGLRLIDERVSGLKDLVQDNYRFIRINEIASGGLYRDEIIIWDIVTGAALWRSQIALDIFSSYIALSRDGRLALCNSGGVYILDVATGKMLSTQKIQPGELAFPCEQDGNHIYIASQSVINVVELGSREPSRKNLSSGHLEQLTTAYHRAVLSPDGRQLATFTRHPVPMIFVCDTLFQNRTCIRIRVHGFVADLALAFSPDSSKLACFLDRKLRVWDVSLKPKTKTLLYHKHHCVNFGRKLLFSNDGVYLAVAYASFEASGRSKRKIGIWNVDTSQRFIYLEDLEPGESLWETFLAFSPSNKFLAFSWHNIVRDVTRVEVWDVTSRKGVFAKSICGDDLKSSKRGSSTQAGPFGSFSRLITESVRLKRLSFSDESHLILDHGDIRIILKTKQSSEPAEEPNEEFVRLRDSNDLTLEQSNSWINFRGEKLLWLPPEYRPHDKRGICIQQNCILITEPYEGRLFLLKFCCSGCIGRIFTPDWQPGESTLCSADVEAPVARPELGGSELEFLTMDPPDDKMMMISNKSTADIWRIVNREILIKLQEVGYKISKLGRSSY
ncbi:NACHT domain-containing protein [Trichoderma breve]|uniref:NACHT domain-containing protein n=1 Tax=Trichoderma breve TaxID=2034170 RepID=A0A9W9EBM6_9HYPO|nr:NACHT domain-containing protein [Trichoderma breve]KAJ4863741.1 NACHT domain-containing protein [Trichoderma breve]